MFAAFGLIGIAAMLLTGFALIIYRLHDSFEARCVEMRNKLQRNRQDGDVVAIVRHDDAFKYVGLVMLYIACVLLWSLGAGMFEAVNTAPLRLFWATVACVSLVAAFVATVHQAREAYRSHNRLGKYHVGRTGPIVLPEGINQSAEDDFATATNPS